MNVKEDRRRAIRQAAERVAREKRIRETPPEERGALAGRYRGNRRTFDLVWVESECGYRREFAHDSAWRWEDPTIIAHTAVQALTKAGTWCGSGSAHHVVAGIDDTRAERKADVSPKEGIQANRVQVTRSRGPQMARVDKVPSTIRTAVLNR